MTTPSKLPTKKALLISTRNVRSRPGSRFKSLPVLMLAHRDAMNLRDELISLHGYQSDNVVLMMDDRNHPSNLWPTRKKILTQMKKLTKNAPENCHFTFYFSGHCIEEEYPERACIREDGLDSKIVCADGESIFDYELHKHLVEPLERVKGSKLFTLFDCCHSENLLDLQRGKRPNIYSRAWSIGAGQFFKDVAIIIAGLLMSNKYGKKLPNAGQPIKRTSTRLLSPSRSSSLEVTVGDLSVVSLSACRDRQLAHDDCERGDTFTKYFIDATTSKPNITWDELRDVLKELISDMRVRYEETRQQGSLANPETQGLSREHWTQEPRLVTNPWTDLRRTISL